MGSHACVEDHGAVERKRKEWRGWRLVSMERNAWQEDSWEDWNRWDDKKESKGDWENKGWQESPVKTSSNQYGEDNDGPRAPRGSPPRPWAEEDDNDDDWNN